VEFEKRSCSVNWKLSYNEISWLPKSFGTGCHDWLRRRAPQNAIGSALKERINECEDTKNHFHTFLDGELDVARTWSRGAPQSCPGARARSRVSVAADGQSPNITLF